MGTASRTPTACRRDGPPAPTGPSGTPVEPDFPVDNAPIDDDPPAAEPTPPTTRPAPAPTLPPIPRKPLPHTDPGRVQAP